MNDAASESERKPKHDHGQMVTITVDSVPRSIKDGVYKISELKEMFSIPQEYELDLMEESGFKPLNDERSLHIKGGEVLVSHVRQGGSS